MQSHKRRKTFHERVSGLSTFTCQSPLTAALTCVQALLELPDFVGGAGFPVYSFSVQAVHLNVVDELFHDQRHRPLVVRQAGDLHPKLPGGELRIELRNDTKNLHSDTLHMETQAHRHCGQRLKTLTKRRNVLKTESLSSERCTANVQIPATVQNTQQLMSWDVMMLLHNTAHSPSCCIWWSSSGSTFCGRRSGTLDKHSPRNQTGHFRCPQTGSASASFSRESRARNKRKR